VYCPAGPVVSTGALTEAPLIVAEPTVHEDPSGPVTSIGFAGSVTASSNVNVTCVGALDRDAPSARSLLFSVRYVPRQGRRSRTPPNRPTVRTAQFEESTQNIPSGRKSPVRIDIRRRQR